MKSIIIHTFTILLLLSQSVDASSQTQHYENLTALRLKAENFIKNNHLKSDYPVVVNVKAINKRMKLKRCSVPINIQYSNERKNYGNTLLKISCSKPVKWKLHLPVTIDVFYDVLALKHPVIKSQSIDESDITVKKMNKKYLVKGFYTHIEQLAQLETKRNLKENTILSPSNLRAKQLIKSGQQVTMVVIESGINIKVSGTALHSASKGQLIKVRNNSSMKTIEGVVMGSGFVKVRL